MQKTEIGVCLSCERIATVTCLAFTNIPAAPGLAINDLNHEYAVKKAGQSRIRLKRRTSLISGTVAWISTSVVLARCNDR
jgi:hypothetical protein